ncbi:MAG: hypothetical protein RL020_35 [Pseudomonadota bacterium]|jgi:hypothetical protein
MFFTKHLKLAIIAVCLLLVGGCSMFKLAYNNADFAISWMLDGYFDLHSEQTTLLKTRLETLQAWHRSEEIPLYVEGLKALQIRARQPLQRADVEWLMEASKKRYERLVQEAAPSAAELLATITPEQIKTLEKKYAKDNKKFAKEHKLNGTPEEQRKARVKKVIEGIEDWVGNLSDEQEAQLRQTVESWPLNYPQMVDDRARRQGEFVSLIEKNREAKTLAPLLVDWMINYEQGRTPEYVAYSQQRTDNFINLVVQTDRLLKPKQRTHLSNKLDGYIADFNSLSRPKQAGQAISNAVASETVK